MIDPALDTLNRRSRFTRSVRSTMLRLSPRDIAILLALYRYRYLRSTQIHALVGGSGTTLRWRLREFFDAGLVVRPRRQWEAVDALYVPTVYALCAAGLRQLQDRGVLSASASVQRVAQDEGHFWHTLLVSEVMCSFELGVRAAPELTLVREDEVLERLAQAQVGHLNERAMPVGDNRYVIPDGLFGIRSPRGVTLYALEVDRGQEPLTRRGGGSAYRDKFARYHELIAGGACKRLLATPAPLIVLHATTTEARMRSMMKFGEGDRFHLFRTVHPDDGVRDPAALVREPWRQAGGFSFSLAIGGVA